MDYSLGHVKNTYRTWGRHPFLYKLGCIITFVGKEKRLRKLTVGKLGLKRGDTALDLACGTGLNLAFLEEAVGPEGKIIAFDYSAEMLEAAKQNALWHGWHNITFIQGDAAELVLDAKVDGVVSTLGVSAIPRHEEALRRALAALDDGKRISILDAQLPSGFWRIFNPLIAWVYRRWAGWDHTKDIPADLRRLADDVEIERFNGGTIYIAHGTKQRSK